MIRLLLVFSASLAGLLLFIALLMAFSGQLPWSAIGVACGGVMCGFMIGMVRRRS